MKKNMKQTMDRLEIDHGIRDLVRQMWKHCYRTKNSCEGHNGEPAYIMFSEGDGWFEENSSLYGLVKRENGECCDQYQQEVSKEIIDEGFNPKKFPNDPKLCRYCGAEMNGNKIYEGNLIKNPLKPKEFQ